MKGITANIPPIKIQGIKTKLLPLIAACCPFSTSARWIEPFMGSGIVGLNLAGKQAVFADLNPYTVAFYQQLQTGEITSRIVRAYLEEQAPKLRDGGIEYYYAVREKFNQSHNPLDFLFLNRACFNGMIRFNRKGAFNVPFGHKPERFAKAYITKIVNQVAAVENRMKISDWLFVCQPFEETIAMAKGDDFIYCDPPYIGRHVDYFDNWDENDERLLHDRLSASGCRFMVSTWHHNKYRTNPYVDTLWSNCYMVCHDHFYHIGAKEQNRNPMVEALLTNYPIECPAEVKQEATPRQLELCI